MVNNSLAKPSNRYRAWIVYLALSFLPVIVGIVLLRIVIQSSIPDYVPINSSITTNDVVGYWHYIATFSQVGFAGGYYGPHEFLSPIAGSRFDGHGPLFPMIYGSIARVTGWSYYTGIYLNFALIALGLFVLLAMLRLSPMRALLMSLIVATFWPLQIYQAVLFQEGFHFAMTLIVAGLFTMLVRDQNRVKWWWIVALFIVLIVLSLIRFSWVLLCVPLFLLLWHKLSLAKVIFSVMSALVVAYAVTYVFGLLTPLSTNSILEIMRAFQSSWSTGWGLLIQSLARNIFGLFHTLTSNRGYNVEVLLYGLLLSVLVISGAGIVFALRQNLYRSTEREAIFHLGSLSLLIGFVIALYLEVGFYRLLGPPLLLSLLVFVLMRPSRIALVVLGVSLAFLPPFIQRYSELESSYTQAVGERLQNETREVERYIQYDPQLTYWCNTIFLPLALYDGRVLTIPAGIGVAWAEDADKLQFPLKSRYILFDEMVEKGTSANYQNVINMELIARLAIGDLYRNLDSGCSDS